MVSDPTRLQAWVDELEDQVRSLQEQLDQLQHENTQLKEEHERLIRTNASMARDLRQMCASHEALQETLAVYRKAYNGTPAPGASKRIPQERSRAARVTHTSLPSGIHRAVQRPESNSSRAPASTSRQRPSASRPLRQPVQTPPLSRRSPVSRTTATRTTTPRPSRALSQPRAARDQGEAPRPYVSRSVRRGQGDLERADSPRAPQGPATRRAAVDRGLLSRATRGVGSSTDTAAKNSPGAMRFVQSGEEEAKPRPSRPLQRRQGSLERAPLQRSPQGEARASGIRPEPGGLHRPTAAERASGLQRPSPSRSAQRARHQGVPSGYYRAAPRPESAGRQYKRTEGRAGAQSRPLAPSPVTSRESGHFTSRSTQEISEAYSDQDDDQQRTPKPRRNYWRED